MTDDPIQITGDDDATRIIRRLVLGVSDLRPFWPRVVTLFRAWIRLQFDSEGSFWGTPWAPLSPAYADRKRILWGEKQILEASGYAKRQADNPRRIARPLSLTLIIDDAGPDQTDALGGVHPHPAILGFHQEPPPGAPYPARMIVGEDLPLLAVYELEREAEGYVQDLLRGVR